MRSGLRFRALPHMHCDKALEYYIGILSFISLCEKPYSGTPGIHIKLVRDKFTEAITHHILSELGEFYM